MRVRGFTLVEVLVAMTILMVVLLTGTYSYRLFSQSWESATQKVDEQRKGAIELRRIGQVLDGIVPLGIYQETRVGFYFFGQSQSLQSVSRNGLYYTHQPVVFELALIADNEEAFLRYSEVPFVEQPLFDVEEIQYPFVYVFDLAVVGAEFRYLGWSNTLAKYGLNQERNQQEEKSWYSSYDSLVSGLFPETVQLTIVTESGDARLYATLPLNSEKLLDTFEGML